MGKTLVAYFSASGVTKKLAQTLADAIGADLFAIEPKVPYTRADLNWMDKQSRSTIEMQNPASRPEIAGTCANIADYDTVFVGFPIWWYVAPTIVTANASKVEPSSAQRVDLSTPKAYRVYASNGAYVTYTVTAYTEEPSPTQSLWEKLQNQINSNPNWWELAEYQKKTGYYK